ncbi:uncharacterized protein LOC105836895 isoform X2 [Monomorium pharaonis]|nr:uncharacterized protein LOC105836895 isoform X2 [Monomorium pharaonis]XP_036148886.1 uncharacterized protein LOC105836895 isoform X2 [Monomorium pharaonis]
MVWTKPRQKNIPSKQMLRLKEGSIPSKLLNIEKKRKRTFEDNDDKKRKKVLICTGVPTYAELVQYMQEKQHAYLEQTTSEDVCEDEHNLSLNVTTKVITNEKITCEENVSVQTLLELLKKSEEEKNKLLMEKAELIEENEKLNDKYTKLNLQFELLEKNMQEKSILSQKK